MRVFLEVVARRSFSRAASELGLSAPATSQSVRALEERLGVELLRRTTRSVTPTPAGERLAARLGPLVAELDASLAEARGDVAGVRGALRLSIPRLAARRLVAPWLEPFAAAHPDVLLEVCVDDALVDMAAGRFDAGIRLGERLAPDVVGIPLGGKLRMSVVASPRYWRKHGVPATPRALAKHRCINYRLAAQGGIYRWEFERAGRAFTLAVGGSPASREGGLVVNDTDLAIAAAERGYGVAFVFDVLIAEQLRKGTLVRVLDAWCPPFPGLYLYYVKTVRVKPALRAFIDFVRGAERSQER